MYFWDAVDEGGLLIDGKILPHKYINLIMVNG